LAADGQHCWSSLHVKQPQHAISSFLVVLAMSQLSQLRMSIVQQLHALQVLMLLCACFTKPFTVAGCHQTGG